MRSLVRALSIAVLLVPVAAAALPARVLAGQTGSRYRPVTVPQAIALCQTIYRNVRVGVRVPGYYVPTVFGSVKSNSRIGSLYASRAAASPPAFGTTHPRIRVIWAERRSAASHRTPGSVTLRGTLDTRTCVLRARHAARDVALKHHSTNRHTITQK